MASDRRVVQTPAKEQRRLLTTNRYNALQLSNQQERAVDLLLRGQRDQEVADELGIHRITVSRWRLHHPLFRATLNQRRRLLRENTEDELRELEHAALGALRGDLLTPGPTRTRVALELFRLGRVRHDLSRHDLSISGETDVDAIIDGEDAARQRREQKEQKARLSGLNVTHRAATVQELLRKANEPPPDDPTT